jgi:hypothetical protein
MTDTFHADLAAILDAVAIHSPLAFAFDGEPPIDIAQNAALSWAVPGGIFEQPGPEDMLVRSIQNVLYDRCYARRLGEKRVELADMNAEDPAFAARLMDANVGRERWDAGWIIQQVAPNGQVFVRKGERERAAMPGEFISAVGPGMAPQPGSTVLVRAPAGALGLQPGYFFAFGETLDELADQLSLARLYFHCNSDNALRLIRELTKALNQFQVPFQMKAPAAPSLYGRTDAMVLYVGARYFPITARIVAVVRTSVPLESSVPLFTKQLWPGIAAASDPGNGESFGTHRCRLTAEGIVQAWREGKQDVSARLASVAARFQAAGLDLARPWLGPGGVDLFELPMPARLP